jgi:hypothetical protein
MISDQANPAPETGAGTIRKRLGTHRGIEFDVAAWAPHEADVDLSFACLFEHESAGADLSGGMLHLDQALGGALTALRAAGTFRARPLETLHVRIPPAGVRPRALMVIGLGEPTHLRSGLLERAAFLALSEAIRLNAGTAAFAPNLLDAGVTHAASLQIEKEMLEGAFSSLALAIQLVAQGKGLRQGFAQEDCLALSPGAV